MPQETNLNVSPYFDDFDKDKNFKKVLFKPALQYSNENFLPCNRFCKIRLNSFGTHFFKEGSKVIPGNLTYNSDYRCVQIESTYLSVPVSLYLEQLVGKRVSGERSGVTAQVISVLTEEESERGIITLYLNYESSSTLDNESENFLGWRKSNYTFQYYIWIKYNFCK